MAISYEEFTEMLLRSNGTYEVVDYYKNPQTRQIDRTTVFRGRGRDLSRFVSRLDGGGQHEHKVFDLQGNLIYYRDYNGRVWYGNVRQLSKNEREAKVGFAAVSASGILRDSWRGAMRWWGSPWR